MATYNGENYIEEQLVSILSQLHVDDEVIIVDDCSTDQTIPIIQSFSDSRIRLFRNQQNLKQIKSFEIALSRARYEWIFLSDQDDIWLPYKVSIYKQIEAISPGIGAIFSNHRLMFDSTISTECMYSLNPLLSVHIPWINTLGHGPSIAFQRALLSRILPFPPYITSHDQWIAQMLSLISNVYFIHAPCQLYRRHVNQVTNKGRMPMFKLLQSRLYTTLNLLMRIVR